MNRRNLSRLLVLAFPMVCLTILVPVRHAQQIDESDVFSSKVQPFLSANCYTCHNSSTRSGGLDLEAYKTTASVLKDRDRWQKVLRRLRAGEMPPEGMPRPDKAQADFVIRWIASQVGAASQPVGSTRSVSPDPGHITARRLNRAEYDNTIRDLLGVNLHPADDFPQDDSGYGFDNIGDVLSLSPILMEKYLAAAEKVARAAVFGPEQLKPTLARQRASAQGILPRLEPLFDYDLSGLTLPNALHLTHRFPVDGEYHFRVFLGGNRPAGSEALDLSLWVDGKQTRVVHFDPGAVATFSQDRQELYGMAQDFRVRLDAGDHWIAASILHLYDGLPPTFKGPNPSKLPIPAPPEFKPPPDLPPERVAEIRKTIAARRAEKIPANDARIASVEIGGPYDQPKGPSLESLKKIYTCGHLDGHHKPGCERKIIADVAHRAFRRPVTPQEVSRLLGLFSMARQHGDSFEEGIVVALEAMLVSPQFLFRLETGVPAATVPTKAPAGVPVTDHELASRLSYFLWSSMPDDDLLRAADQGVLHKPEVLNSQVRRMLKDGRAHALVDNFGGQWLELRKLESVRPDRKRFPEFDEYLAMSMRRETELFFENIIHQDLSILDFVDGNYSFLNERLARFYKIPGVSGPEFRRVDLSGTERSGVLTQASVLTVSSYATRTSPVLRGKWILENLLNAAPPPPPPDVPNLDETKIGQSMSLREQLEVHRKNATCAACHTRMDPLGFGLENFNAIGAWRTEDGKFPIDPSGVLPDGRTFKGPGELKAILRADRDDFAQGVTVKLLTYALGRGLEAYDMPAVKKITVDMAADDYRFSSLVLGIVRSLPFQMRRGDRT